MVIINFLKWKDQAEDGRKNAKWGGNGRERRWNLLKEKEDKEEDKWNSVNLFN